MLLMDVDFAQLLTSFNGSIDGLIEGLGVWCRLLYPPDNSASDDIQAIVIYNRPTNLSTGRMLPLGTIPNGTAEMWGKAIDLPNVTRANVIITNVAQQGLLYNEYRKVGKAVLQGLDGHSYFMQSLERTK